MWEDVSISVEVSGRALDFSVIVFYWRFLPGFYSKRQTHCLLFLRTRQNELRPNQPNARVKPAATATRPAVVWPAVYFVYWRTSAARPDSAITRNTTPVTSSHN